MTLVFAVPTRHAVVIASDTQVSDQRTRTSNTKIKRLTDSCLWAAAGHVSVIQRLEERLSLMDLEHRTLSELREPIGLAIRGVMDDVLRLDFRVPYVENDPWRLGNLYGSSFVFAEYRDSLGKILSFGSTGGGEWYTYPHAIGGASDFAVALTKNYRVADLTADQAALLVVTTLETAIATAQSGIDYPLDVWRIDARGPHQLSAAERAALYLEADRFRAAQREIIEHWTMTGGDLGNIAANLDAATIESLAHKPRERPRES